MGKILFRVSRRSRPDNPEVKIVWLFIIAVLLFPAPCGSALSGDNGDNVAFFGEVSPAGTARPGDAWSQKLSSDLMQLLDPSSCSPGRTPADTAAEMKAFGQLRYDSDHLPLVSVLVRLTGDAQTERILPLLNETRIDPSYGILTGWVRVGDLQSLAVQKEVRQVETLLPPVTAGTGSLVQTPDPGLSLISGSPETGAQDPAWKEKLSTDLLQLLDSRYLSPGQSSREARRIMEKTGELRVIGEGQAEVMVSARISPGTPETKYRSYFSTVSSDSRYGQVAGWLAIPNLSVLARDPGITSVMAQIPPHTSRVVTQGDDLLYAADFRNTTSLTGKGIMVGVISDGVSSIDTVKAVGELPESVLVIRDSIGGDEGTAMLQIIHDIAPDAPLVFHDRGASQIEFVQAMDRLINAGCRIICDDITYVEPFFEDGYIARNIRDRILSYGILYVTSSGNFAREHYQGPFTGYMDQGYAWHDFQGSNGSRDMRFCAPAHSAGHIILQWDDPFAESSNNYDLFLYNGELREIGRSVKIQDGDDDPMEYCRFINDDETPRDYCIRVVQAGGENRTLELYVLPMGGTPVTVDPSVREDSIFGQQSVSEALSVGAVMPVAGSPRAEPYSSRGPVTIKYPRPELRQKPELAAPDRVTVSGGYGSLASFSGTSAAAPHIAGLAALLWSAGPHQTNLDIRSALINATGNMTQTWDPSIGYGIPDSRLLLDIARSFSSEDDPADPASLARTFRPREGEPADILILYPGWNMVSVPFPLESNTTPGFLFSGIDTVSHTIWRYSPGGQQWTAVQPGDVLMQMDVIWIYSQDRTTLSLRYDDGREKMTARHLQPGWNPLGIPGKTTVTARELFSPLGKNWSYLLVFDPRIQQYRPAIVNGGTGAYSDERLLYPTEGFWIYMNAPGIVIP